MTPLERNSRKNNQEMLFTQCFVLFQFVSTTSFETRSQVTESHTDTSVEYNVFINAEVTTAAYLSEIDK